jgi:gamma-glutamylcyclotransferase (GGCT)/AIG2-like uncharacterized protein YtfP
MKEIKVFVYGTLKRGNKIRGLDKVQGARFVSEACTVDSSFVMLDLGSFPAVMIATPSQTPCKIGGEIFMVTADVFAHLDIIEGYPDFYNRMLVETTHGWAWMYYLNSIDCAVFYDDSDQINITDNVSYWHN